MLTNGMAEAKAEMEASQDDGGMGSLGNVFGQPDVLQKIAANPQTAAFLADPGFVAKIQSLQRNPSAIGQHLQDQRVLQVMGMLMGVNIQTPDAPMPQASAPPPKYASPLRGSARDAGASASQATSAPRPPRTPLSAVGSDGGAIEAERGRAGGWAAPASDSAVGAASAAVSFDQRLRASRFRRRCILFAIDTWHSTLRRYSAARRTLADEDASQQRCELLGRRAASLQCPEERCFRAVRRAVGRATPGVAVGEDGVEGGGDGLKSGNLDDG